MNEKKLTDMKKDYYPLLLPNQYHHCVNHSVGEALLFKEAENYAYFLDKYKKYIAPITTTYAYCLMPNHFHFLIKVHSKELLQTHYKKLKPYEKHDWETFDYAKFVSQQFSNFFNSYAKSFNKKYKRRGGLFEDYFKRPIIDSENYFLNTIRYIHQNPIRHGFVDTLETWNYTSYLTFLNASKKGRYKSEILNLFGSEKEFIDFHQNFNLDEFYDDEMA
jgi:putative transposase